METLKNGIKTKLSNIVRGFLLFFFLFCISLILFELLCSWLWFKVSMFFCIPKFVCVHLLINNNMCATLRLCLFISIVLQVKKKENFHHSTIQKNIHIVYGNTYTSVYSHSQAQHVFEALHLPLYRFECKVER